MEKIDKDSVRKLIENFYEENLLKIFIELGREAEEDLKELNAKPVPTPASEQI